MRKVADCRKTSSASGCPVTIAGREDEVMDLAVYHAVKTHGHKDTPQLRSDIRKVLSDET